MAASLRGMIFPLLIYAHHSLQSSANTLTSKLDVFTSFKCSAAHPEDSQRAVNSFLKLFLVGFVSLADCPMDATHAKEGSDVLRAWCGFLCAAELLAKAQLQAIANLYVLPKENRSREGGAWLCLPSSCPESSNREAALPAWECRDFGFYPIGKRSLAVLWTGGS